MRDFTDDEIREMREEFIDLLRMIDRPNARIEELINKLDETDFFTAPASTKYHNSCYGGLVNHSLNVYYNLERLVIAKGLEDEIPADTRIIVALCHDFAKINFYERTSRNKKVYSADGSKYDELGRFDWVAEMSWGVKPDNERFIYGSHEENSEFITRCYIPLKVEESIAILHHHAGKGSDSMVRNVNPMYNKHKIVTLIHLADMMATYVDEAE